MPRGLPDYGIPQYALATPSIDMATLFLAQTGICSVDGKGRIFYADNFHAGLAGFDTFNMGNGKLPYPTSTYCYIPPLSLGFNPGTYNGNGGAGVTKWFVIPDTEKMGLEVNVAAGSDHPVWYGIKLDYCYVDGSSKEWDVYWNTNNGAVQIHSNGQLITIDTYYINTYGWYYVPIKFVVNVKSGKYDRLLIGNKGYNLSSYSYNTSYLTVKGMLALQLYCIAVLPSTSGDYGRYGYIMLTVDEP